MGRLYTTKVNFDFFIILFKSDDNWSDRLINVVSHLSDLYTQNTKEKHDNSIKQVSKKKLLAEHKRSEDLILPDNPQKQNN